MININKIICGDSLLSIKKMKIDSVTLTICSPPYNLVIPYGEYKDDMPYKDYLKWLQDIFTEVFRVTRDGGRIAINIDAVTNRQEDKDQEYIRNIYADLSNLMKSIGWKFRSEICWYKQNAVGKQTSWGSWCAASNPVIRRNHEYILVWSKKNWKLEGDSELSDMTVDEFCQYTLSTWFISPETRKMGNHPCPFCEKLVRRLIKLYSYRGDTVLDCFNGVGTTTYMANKLKRKYIGIDIDKKYCEFARQRIKKDIDLFEEEYIPRSRRLAQNKKDDLTQKEDLFEEGL